MRNGSRSRRSWSAITRASTRSGPARGRACTPSWTPRTLRSSRSSRPNSAPRSRRCGCTSCINEVKSERDPPDEVVRDAEDDALQRPRAGRDQLGEPDRAEDFAEEADRGDGGAALGMTRDLPIEEAVDADDHGQAGEDLRMIRKGHSGVTEQPLRIARGVRAPGEVVRAGQGEGDLVKAAAFHGSVILSRVDGEGPPADST